MTTPTLWHIELSHYSEKIRFALAYKRVAHGRRAPMPGLHGPVAMALTGSGHRRFPVLQLGGRAIGDSTAIVAALEEAYPDPPLYPDDPDERRRALALEEVFDEELATAVRSFAFHHVMGEPGGIAAAVAPNRPAMRRTFEVSEPLARLIIRSDYGANAERAAAAREEILRIADRVEEELGGGDYLVGGRFTIADLAGAALFTPLLDPPGREHLPDVQPPELMAMRNALMDRHAGQWVHEMYVRHRT